MNPIIHFIVKFSKKVPAVNLLSYSSHYSFHNEETLRARVGSRAGPGGLDPPPPPPFKLRYPPLHVPQPKNNKNHFYRWIECLCIIILGAQLNILLGYLFSLSLSWSFYCLLLLHFECIFLVDQYFCTY